MPIADPVDHRLPPVKYSRWSSSDQFAEGIVSRSRRLQILSASFTTALRDWLRRRAPSGAACARAPTVTVKAPEPQRGYRPRR